MKSATLHFRSQRRFTFIHSYSSQSSISAQLWPQRSENVHGTLLLLQKQTNKKKTWMTPNCKCSISVWNNVHVKLSFKTYNTHAHSQMLSANICFSWLTMCSYCTSHVITEFKRLLRSSHWMTRGHAPRTVYVRDSHGCSSRCQKSLKTNAVSCLWNEISAETVTLQLHYWRWWGVSTNL